MPAATIVRPITVSLTPRAVAAATAPFTSTWEPTTSRPRPAASLAPATGAGARSLSSISSTSVGFSEALRTSHTRLITRAVSRATPACQVTRPAEAMPHTAVDTANSSGTSRRTRRLFTFSGTIAALRPSTTSTLKMLLPTMLLTAMASPAGLPSIVESRLTNSSGALVPSDTTVRPITIWGMPSSSESATEPATKSSPPPNSSRIPTTIAMELVSRVMPG